MSASKGVIEYVQSMWKVVEKCSESIIAVFDRPIASGAVYANPPVSFRART